MSMRALTRRRLLAQCAAGAAMAAVTRYTAASGARVFSASSLQFTWALDDFLARRPADARVQQLVRNVLADVLR